MISTRDCTKMLTPHCGVSSRSATCLGRTNAVRRYSFNSTTLETVKNSGDYILTQRIRKIGFRPSRQRAVIVQSYRNDTTIPGNVLKDAQYLLVMPVSAKSTFRFIFLKTSADRVISGVPYLLPLFDGLRYGKFLFVQYPIIAKIISPLNPLIQVYFSVPFAG